MRQSVDEVLKSFRLADGVFVLGCLERGVTAYSQQVRALNLVWALRRGSTDEPKRLAIIGGGLAGLTAAAAVLLMFEHTEVYLYERRSDLCPLQLGCDTRWLHPRIYAWPDEDSRRPSAGLPFNDWREGRASDVAHQVISGFAKIAQGKSLRIFVETAYLRLDVGRHRVHWMGKPASLVDSHCVSTGRVGAEMNFDVVLLATGFGLETPSADHETPSYWRNDKIAQPVLDRQLQKYVVSGRGDGGIIDLCRLVIERYRQDRIVYDMFGAQLEESEAELRALKMTTDFSSDPYAALRAHAGSLQGCVDRLRNRVRKDTFAIFQNRGAGAETTIQHALRGNSSFLNKLMLFALFELGAFELTFDALSNVVREQGIPAENVVLRHGADALPDLRRTLLDGADHMPRLQEMRDLGAQAASPQWDLGFFPLHRW
jgi:hypothetical protein